MKVLQSRLWLVVAVIAALLFVGILANPSFNYETLPLDQLLVSIEESRVREIRVNNDGTSVSVIYNDGTQYRTTKPADLSLLDAANMDSLEKPFVYVQENNPLGEILRAGALIILPLIMITTLYMFYMGWSAAQREAKKT